jgi:hypothetical protein
MCETGTGQVALLRDSYIMMMMDDDDDDDDDDDGDYEYTLEPDYNDIGL